MKIKSLLFFSFALMTFVLFTSLKKNPSNPPPAKTGAPGESTCQESGCHGGGSFTGVVTVSGVPDTIIPNTVYDVTLTHMSNAVRAGFQLTALDSLNIKSGILTASSGSNLINSGGRSYIRQSTFKTLSNSLASWTFKWKAPATAAGNKVTFWFTSLAANGNGNDSGDNVLKSSKTYKLDTTTDTNEPDVTNQFKLYPNPAKSFVNVSMPVSYADLEIYTLDGKLCKKQSISDKEEVDLSSLISGNYIATFRYDNKVVTKKLIKE